MSEREASLALRRFGLGPRPGDVERIAGDPRAAILAELEISGIARLDDPALPSSSAVYVAIRRDQIARQAARRVEPKPEMSAADPPDGDGMTAPARKAVADASPRQSMVFYQSEIAAKAARHRTANIGYVERLVDFWSNHFALQGAKDEQIRGLAGAFEREAIRPHVLGRFEDMLLAATRHPAMLLSLDNAGSTGPDSPAGRRSGHGLNENHAREILELHTLGVDGGYSQQDVTEFSRILTGWTFGRDIRKPDAGAFRFVPARHEPGARTLIGKVYPAEANPSPRNERQGLDALHDLAGHPATARHLAGKLARHFVDDDPPADLVASLAQTFRETGGDLKAGSRRLVETNSAWGSGRKFATPQQFVGASLRASGVELPPPRAVGLLRSLGQAPWTPTSPAGFEDDAATWLSPDGMTTRLEVADRIARQAKLVREPEQLAEDLFGADLSADTRQTLRRAESGRQALALLFMSPEFQWR